MGHFTLSRKELHRPGLLKALCGGRLTNAQVAAALPDHCAAGPAAEAPVRGRGPRRARARQRDRPRPGGLPAAVRDAVVRLMTDRHVGFNDTT